LASDSPIPITRAETLAARLPGAAAADLIEWEPGQTPERLFDAIVQREVPVDEVIAVDSRAPLLTDDRPVNEYVLVHRFLWGR
jgi:hypothetical protein